MKKLLLLTVVLGLLTGCGTIQTDASWIRKDGTYPINVQADRQICRESLLGVPDNLKREVFDSCMDEKGYKWGVRVYTYHPFIPPFETGTFNRWEGDSK